MGSIQELVRAPSAATALPPDAPACAGLPHVAPTWGQLLGAMQVRAAAAAPHACAARTHGRVARECGVWACEAAQPSCLPRGEGGALGCRLLRACGASS